MSIVWSINKKTIFFHEFLLNLTTYCTIDIIKNLFSRYLIMIFYKFF